MALNNNVCDFETFVNQKKKKKKKFENRFCADSGPSALHVLSDTYYRTYYEYFTELPQLILHLLVTNAG